MINTIFDTMAKTAIGTLVFILVVLFLVLLSVVPLHFGAYGFLGLILFFSMGYTFGEHILGKRVE